MENRKTPRPAKELHVHETDAKLLEDEESKAFDEGQEAAKEVFGKLTEDLSKQKEKRK